MSAAHLAKFRELPEFWVIIEAIKAHRPIVTNYFPKASMDAEQAQLQKIKYDMAKQEGFDVVVELLEGKRALNKEKKNG